MARQQQQQVRHSDSASWQARWCILFTVADAATCSVSAPSQSPLADPLYSPQHSPAARGVAFAADHDPYDDRSRNSSPRPQQQRLAPSDEEDEYDENGHPRSVVLRYARKLFGGHLLTAGNFKIALISLGLLIASTGNSIMIKKMTNKMNNYPVSRLTAQRTHAAWVWRTCGVLPSLCVVLTCHFPLMFVSPCFPLPCFPLFLLLLLNLSPHSAVFSESADDFRLFANFFRHRFV